MHPSFIDTMDFMQNNVLQKIDAAHFGPGGDDDNQYTEDFLSGDSAMLFNGVWATGDFTDCEAGIDTENFTPSSSQIQLIIPESTPSLNSKKSIFYVFYGRQSLGLPVTLMPGISSYEKQK